MPTLQGHDPTPEQLKAGQRTGNQTQALQAKWSKIRQCLEAQQLIMSQFKEPDCSASERCSLITAWDKLEDRIRILKGKPLPGVLKPELRERPRRRAMIAADSHAVLEAMVRERLSREQTSAPSVPPAAPQE